MRLFGGRAVPTEGAASAKALGHTGSLRAFLQIIKEACEVEESEQTGSN